MGNINSELTVNMFIYRFYVKICIIGFCVGLPLIRCLLKW